MKTSEQRLRFSHTASALWTSIEGRNLGLETRELDFTSRKVGDWKFTLDHNEIVRFGPYTIDTGGQNLDSTTPTFVRLATPGTGRDLNLDTKRKAISLGGSARFAGALQFEANLRSEEKEGARMFGKGFACSASWVAAGSCAAAATQAQWALLFSPEPPAPRPAAKGGMRGRPGRVTRIVHSRVCPRGRLAARPPTGLDSLDAH